ncbi:MAG: nicotinate-nucleotide--dimethylbenzimidazole phosphoribosyltransferase [bacterium]
MGKLENTLNKICKIDHTNQQDLQQRLDRLTKPKDSLGRLEELAKWYTAIRGEKGNSLQKKVVVVMAGDHGIAQEGVSAFPQAVTEQMIYNFIKGGAAINVLARQVKAEVVVVDMGVACDLKIKEGVIDKKIAYGTRNIAAGTAMTREEAIRALDAGIEVAEMLIEKGADILATGDMGIGNTTPSSAIVAVFTNRKIEEVTGKGTGICNEGLKKKIALIEKALELNKPDKTDPLDVLAKVGGFEIGGLAGLIIGAAANRVPVVIDGFISTAGALIATEIEPKIKNYLVSAHNSVEKGHKIMLERMGLRPLLDLELRLGEGTGAALAFGLVEAGVKILNEMATFEDAGVSDKE